ncbi:type II toxin-antitoxin system VapC family toxin [Longimicrobium sp.]|uniref:type II toxin-antitoxin system VapC family toxin n=1 Tax=Longimicrobium sp. TaxID=2029185 RepID=UPI003B3AA58F
MIATSIRPTRDPLFLDTGFLIALNAADDQYHKRAVDHWRLIGRTRRLLTTSYVVDEVVTAFNSRGRHQRAVEIGTLLITSSWVQLLHVDEELFRAGWEYLVKHADKRYSLTDCISFVVMNQMGVQDALTFDAHFEQAGFRRLP